MNKPKLNSEILKKLFGKTGIKKESIRVDLNPQSDLELIKQIQKDI